MKVKVTYTTTGSYEIDEGLLIEILDTKELPNTLGSGDLDCIAEAELENKSWIYADVKHEKTVLQLIQVD